MNVNTCVDMEMDHDDLRDLIREYKYGRYCEDPSLRLEDSQRLVLDQVLQVRSSGGSSYITASSASGQILGLLSFKLSNWDTDHFGYNVAIIDSVITKEFGQQETQKIVNALLDRFHVWGRANDVRFVSARVPSLNLPVTHSFERSGFRFIESYVYYKYDLMRIAEFQEPQYKLRFGRPEDRDTMLDYSTDAFATHRFHADCQIARHKAESLYKRWIITAFQDSQQHILVLNIEERPVAFMIYHISDLREYFGMRFAAWTMALLGPVNRGRGMGTAFFTALLHYHLQEGLDFVESGVSMRNLASINPHNKVGFKVVSMLVTFHKWLSK